MMYPKWTEKEQRILIDKYNEGLTNKEIETFLANRTLSAVKAQIAVLKDDGKLLGQRKHKVTVDKRLTTLEKELLDLLKKTKGKITDGEASRHLDRSKETTVKTYQALVDKGYNIEYIHEEHMAELKRDISIWKHEPTNLEIYRNWLKFAVLSDTHIGSQYQQLTLLHDAYSVIEKEKCAFVLHPGDTNDGNGNIYRGQPNDLIHRYTGRSANIDEVFKYVVDNYPKSNLKTYMISGNHDDSWLRDSGFNFIKALAKERGNIIYKGDREAIFTMKGLKIVLKHPRKGIAYARSYHPQKIIEGIGGYILQIANSYKEIKEKLPRLVLFGHWHQPCSLVPYMGMSCYSLPGFQAQTPFMRDNGWIPSVGFMIFEVKYDDKGNIMSIKETAYIWNHLIKEKDY